MMRKKLIHRVKNKKKVIFQIVSKTNAKLTLSSAESTLALQSIAILWQMLFSFR
jgi:hypothetical protein